MNSANDYVVDDHLTFSFFLEGVFCCECIEVWKSFLANFFFAKFGVLELSRVDFNDFSVFEFFWNRQNPLLLCVGSDQIDHACYFCFWDSLEVAMPVSVLLYFLVDPVPVSLLRTPSRFFSSFVSFI